MSAFVHFLCIDLTIVDAAPGVEDVGDDKRNQDRNVSHGFQRKLAGTTVGKGERALYIRVRRIISCIVISGSKQQCQDGEYRTNAGKPDPFIECLLQHCFANAEQHQHNPCKEYNQHYRHFDKVIEILIRFHIDLLCFRIDSISVGQQSADHKS